MKIVDYSVMQIAVDILISPYYRTDHDMPYKIIKFDLIEKINNQ